MRRHLSSLLIKKVTSRVISAVALLDAHANKIYQIKAIYLSSVQRLKLFDLGFTLNSRIELISKAPFNHGVLVNIKGFNIVLKKEIASGIEVVCVA